ncbi:hypothetical protein C5167_040935 [Papaver somniferum]|uniref:Polygalacturonase n=1 Tax=Papaver somniferum TaxID=3469 RepID=A0A4Y7IGG0_PAPSO|nr:probable polygalacturonase At3g15720 isoform X2 [Papaver somniferum]RZC48003.1 hypothetical protein C5167_040935 [Papaver somniferum]
MGSKKILLIFGLIISTYIHVASARGVFNVMKFGAVGDGIRDDTQAFLKAWAATCGDPKGIPKMLVPRRRTFLVGPVDFVGPCKATNVTVEIGGTIVAPLSTRAWAKDVHTWLKFNNIHGLTVNGHGVIDARGKAWWEQSCHNFKHQNQPGCTQLQPAAINFWGTNAGTFRDMTVKNAAMFHVTLLGLDGFEVHNININSPEDTPNTDGIHTQNVKHVTIADSQFRSGDDCVSIGDKSSYVYVRNCHCGPGHGVSIGSLGSGGTEAQVEEIHVENIKFVGTMFGCRIKTYQGGKGYCRAVTFKHSNFTNVLNPLYIDQHYFSNNPVETSAVRISDVTFDDLRGTTDIRTPSAISMKCSNVVACTGLKFNNIHLTPAKPGTKLVSTINNAHGAVLGRVEPPLVGLKAAI